MSDYFNSPDYLEYLKANCGVRGYDFEERTEVCTRPDVDIVMRYLRLMDVQPTDKLLEVGCGLGRILKEIHETYGIKPYGIDPFNQIVNGARERVGAITGDLRVSGGEKIDFPDEFFDKVLCWATFDLTEQERSLCELGRVLKPGGRLLLTGKADNYHDDDEEAHLAEAASRRKGIPNHYTDFPAMLRLAGHLGLEPRDFYFFERRGDFMNDVVLKEMPERLYEWCVLFEKTRSVDPAQVPSIEICSLYSKTFRRTQPEASAVS